MVGDPELVLLRGVGGNFWSLANWGEKGAPCVGSFCNSPDAGRVGTLSTLTQKGGKVALKAANACSLQRLREWQGPGGQQARCGEWEPFTLEDAVAPALAIKAWDGYLCLGGPSVKKVRRRVYWSAIAET
ncbi:MAG: hypothetical protein IPH05_08955 [Flavobacteriales bacterium]|nr:hypothetical protein [Flavobacteriales bacterium]